MLLQGSLHSWQFTSEEHSMADKKHYVIVSLTLGLIAAASALLIAGTNLLTKDRIAKNEQKKINDSIAFIFGAEASIKSESEITDESYKYVNYVYEVASDKDLGYVFRTTGSNMYGKITLVIGFDLNNNFVSMKSIVNEQTFTKEVENYIKGVDDQTITINDVNCGATFGAKLVREMVNEASLANKEKVWKK